MAPGSQTMKVLLTGADGYIGVIMGPKLIEAGHEVVGLDTGFYRRGWLFDDRRTHPKVVTKDLRAVTIEDLQGFDAVVHLSELSNDPIGENDPGLTMEINHKGSVALAEKARAAGVKRFIYASSCSTYGAGGDEMRTEESDLAPQTAYAKCKILVETDVRALRDDSFTPTFMRNATAYGASPRQRFDIVLNNLAGLAWVEKVIAMNSDGTPWRPMVHALDIAKAIRTVLDAPLDKVHSTYYNVGSFDNNYTVREIAQTVADEFPGCQLSFGPPSADNRSYKVNFDRIEETLGFSCDWNLAMGAKQLHAVFETIQLDAETFYGRGHTRLKQIEHLLNTGQIDKELFWKQVATV